uniref:Uncharacterized protein n=1 Tax=Caenorhabditis japonica TaxID=281687 RepID=A0A8R1DS67_CAEJA
MSGVKRVTWCFILVLGPISLATCDFTTQLSALQVVIHLAALSVVHFALVFPPEELLDGLGITLFDLFSILKDPEQYGFIEYVCKRQTFFKTFVALYPAAFSGYFVHGNMFMRKEFGISRFPELLDNPIFWNTFFVISIFSALVYNYHISDYKKWPFYQYFIDNPECLNQVEELVSEPDTFKIRFCAHTFLYCNRNFFAYVSNWRLVAVKQADLRLLVDNTRMPMIPNMDDEERLRHIFVIVSFRQPYLPVFTISLRHDLYRQLNEVLAVPIIVPAHITIPLTIMEELKEDFIERVAQNDRHIHHAKASDKEPCFACGTEENIIKIVKTCADNNERWQWSREGQRVYTDQCQVCVCRPLWCNRCIAQIFIGKQNIDAVYRHDYWRGTAQCPTCRKAFCIRDVHLVEFVLEED